MNLYAGHLAAAAPAAVLAGANRLAVQNDAGTWEIVGFANAALIGPATYALTHLLRGQGGTGAAIGPAAAGNRVMLLDAAVVSQLVPTGRAGETLSLRAFAGRADPTGRPLTAVLDLAPDLPLPPRHLRAVRDPASGDVTLTFVRCSRADADSWALAEAPLDATPEAYLVSVLNGASVVRRFSVGVPVATYPAAAQLADFGTLPPSFGFTVAQISPVWGPGLSATGAFHG